MAIPGSSGYGCRSLVALKLMMGVEVGPGESHGRLTPGCQSYDEIHSCMDAAIHALVHSKSDAAGPFCHLLDCLASRNILDCHTWKRYSRNSWGSDKKQWVNLIRR